MIAPSEAERERETLDYAYPLSEAFSAPAGTLVDLDGLDAHPITSSWSTDSALIAFAQLAAIKTNAARCLISLFDRDRQYVVVEATADSAITPSATPCDTWLGGSSIPRRLGICEHVLPIPQLQGCANAPDALPVSVVPDLELDPCFSDRPYIKAAPFNHFYAGTPIRSPNGINIGVLCIFDTVPRPGLTNAQTSTLRQLSHTIMGHIELRLARHRSERYERMVHGLSSFMAGEAEVSGPSLASAATEPPETVVDGVTRRQDDGLDVDQDQDQVSTPERPTPTPIQSGSLTSTDLPAGQSTTCDTADPVETPGTVLAAASATSTATVASLGGSMRKEVRDVFTRAAPILRKSLQAHGVAFLDASVVSFGGLVPGEAADPSMSLHHAGRRDSSVLNSLNSQDSMCSVLGLAVSNSPTTLKDSLVSSNISVPESLLQTVLRQNPRGGIFELSSSPDTKSSVHKDPSADGHPTSTTQAASSTITDNGENIVGADDLAVHFPRAHWVLFLPLRDPSADRCLACGFVWSQDPARLVTLVDDLRYFRAFGGTVMSEIVGINTALAEASKNDLLESLSHELRSPLHGIVTSAELLHDTELTAFQGDVLHSMESCGRTLLDVINHLLDYTKINRLAKSTKDQVKLFDDTATSDNENALLQSQLTTLTSSISVDTLVEETVESVFAGYRFLMPAPSSLDAEQHDTPSDRSFAGTFGMLRPPPRADDDLISIRSSTNSHVAIFLDIAPNVSWLGSCEPGALRRLIMNVLGNSLKFTTKGCVLIRLGQECSSSGRTLTLTISDTGRGIAPEFLRNEVFTPFKQEDSLDPGAGLGLSLVRQILDSLGGTVQLESKRGFGTVATLTLPFPVTNTVEADSAFKQHLSALKNLRVSLRGLGHEVRAEDRGFVPFSESVIMHDLCKDWLKLEVVPADSVDVRPDILICSDLTLKELVPPGNGGILPPVVVICRNALTAHVFSKRHRESGKTGIMEFISQPAGPRKVAKAMILALDRYRDSRNSEALSEGFTSATDQWSIPSARTSPFPADPVPDGGDPLVTPLSSVEGSPFDLAFRTANLGRPTSCTTQSRPDTTAPASARPCTKYLLVDDNKINLKILVAFMKKSKREWTTAENGLEAVEAYLAGPKSYSGILMDISMPVMDGLVASRRIREFERTRDLVPTTIIALTGIASASAQQEAFASGIDLFMTKPVRLKELAEILAKNEGMRSG
ncbi:hypothetical protein S7711_02835 [Stachybotrys chartarum IBT 7711]|uniref:histidine kinase n=1 Tax=Stachybotrys chartarum (strain CBS 109288 / IBT 7711) TaxID=1280523 RepID=A0A084AH52_STACB|nr:hypothetical protein S7711_02835 [Stachybotrys chartarum IBT 7711]